MDFEERKTKPESTREFLISQVEQQADCCDVTIKVGEWEKRFHRCVLLKSLFFDCIFKNEYRENRTGKIQIHLGTPVTVEMALMFLYGKKPKFTVENAETMLTLAEFFLLPNLKSACVSWLHVIEVTEENYFVFLRLASFYNFELAKCTEYLEGHLTEFLRNEEAVSIDAASLQYMLSEKKFSYVTMDDKLKFLLRWTKYNTVGRKESAIALLRRIDVCEIDPALLQELENDPLLADISDDNPFNLINADKEAKHNVLLMKYESYGSMFWCLDLNREKWFQLEAKATVEERQCSFSRIAGVIDCESSVWFEESYRKDKVTCINLETDTCQVLSFFQKENPDMPMIPSKIAFFGNLCVVTESKSVSTSKSKPEVDTEIGMRSRLALMSLAGYSTLDQILLLDRLMNKSNSCTTDTTVVYLGNITGDRIEVEPIFSMLSEQVSEICLSKLKTLLMLTKSRKRIVLYDINECKLEVVREETTYEDKVSPSETGFVVFNNERCISLKRLTGPGLNVMYQVKKNDFKTIPSHYSKMFFCSDRWYRYFRKDYREAHLFEWASHEDMMATATKGSVKWTTLPLPQETSQSYAETIRDQLFHVRLSKNRLKCDINCPHCRAQKKSTTMYRTVDSDDESYYDSSADDNYCFGVDDYDYGYEYYDSD